MHGLFVGRLLSCLPHESMLAAALTSAYINNTPPYDANFDTTSTSRSSELHSDVQGSTGSAILRQSLPRHSCGLSYPPLHANCGETWRAIIAHRPPHGEGAMIFHARNGTRTTATYVQESKFAITSPCLCHPFYGLLLPLTGRRRDLRIQRAKSKSKKRLINR